jgi:DNA-directed RNA polymerase subunit RPC12/RpoP
MNYYRAYRAMCEGEKVPRKWKKKVLGRKVGKQNLTRLLKTVVVLSNAKTMYESPKIEPYAFCPNCGCTQDYGTGNMTTYPEHWEIFRCLRCRSTVGAIDNSPYYHVLQFAPEYKLPF